MDLAELVIYVEIIVRKFFRKIRRLIDERLMFGKFLMSSRTTDAKSENQQKTLKMILDKFREKDLLEDCPRILDEFSEYFRFFSI